MSGLGDRIMGNPSRADFMTASIRDNLRYWRTSLADSVLGTGKFTESDRKRFVGIPAEALKSGVLPKVIVDQVFRDQTSARTVAVLIWPLAMARKKSHGAARAGGLPEIVAASAGEQQVLQEA